MMWVLVRKRKIAALVREVARLKGVVAEQQERIALLKTELAQRRKHNG